MTKCQLKNETQTVNRQKVQRISKTRNVNLLQGLKKVLKLSKL